MADFEIKKTLKLIKPFSKTYKVLRERHPIWNIFYCHGCNIYVVFCQIGSAQFKISSESNNEVYDLDYFDYDIEPRSAMSGEIYVRL